MDQQKAQGVNVLKFLRKIKDYILIKRSGLFDEEYYCLQYPDVRQADVDPLWHFVSLGWKECRNPSVEFNVQVYLENYADIKSINKNPFVHFIQFGCKEGRTSLPMSEDNSSVVMGLSQDESGTNSESQEKNLRQTSHDVTGREILKKQQDEFGPKIILSKIVDFDYTPLISIIMPMYNPDLECLKRAIVSLQDQYYTKWELCITDDGSSTANGIDYIKKSANVDRRIKLNCREENGGISAASNDSLRIAAGEYIALIDQDDEIPPDALYWVVEALQNDRTIDFIYTDECKIDSGDDRNYSEFFFKPDWSPEMMINFMYTGHLTAYKKELVDQIGGFISAFDYSQDYDLALRASEKAVKIHHIERVLYFWRKLPGSGARGDKDYSILPTMLALKSHYERQGVNVLVTNKTFGRQIKIINRPSPKISIIIPTDNETNIINLIPMIISRTSYSNFEIVIVTTSEVCKKIEDRFPYYSSNFLRLNGYDKQPFNFSDKCNQGSKAATGDVLLFLNDDAVPQQCDWLEPMLDLLLLPGVGGVSPLMIYEDGRVQYAGIQAGQHFCGLFGPSFHFMSIDDHEGMIVNPLLIRNVSVLSGACLMIKKNLFIQVSGFDAINTPNGHSDVDLSLRIMEAGFRCVYTPYSMIKHPGSGTWSLLNLPDKANIYLIMRWNKYLERDSYFTKSMRRYNLSVFDLPYELHLPENWKSPTSFKDTILIISHELSRTGAPVVAALAAKILKEQGYFVIVGSFREEPVLVDLLNYGIPTIIDKSFENYKWHIPEDVPLMISSSIRGIINEFDLVIANTFVCHNIVNCYNETSVKILWWLHEGYASFEDGQTRFAPKKLGKNIRVLCGGKYVQKVLRIVGIDYKTDVMLYGVEDIFTPLREKLQKKVRFIFPGSYEKRKNHKMLFEAIQMLSEESKNNSEFICLGTYWDEAFYHKLCEYAQNISNLTLLPPMPYEKLVDLYDTCDCVVVPSIDDPMPVVLTEGMMLSKIVLCSNKTGTAEYIKDGVSGFVFDCYDAKALSKRFEFVIDNRETLNSMKKEARSLYERYFSMGVFREKLMTEVKDLISLGQEEIEGIESD